MFSLVTGLYFIVTSGNGEESNLATAILTDLNRRSYPKYEIVRSGPIFKCRADWLEYVETQELGNRLYEKTLDKEPTGDELEEVRQLTGELVLKWKMAISSTVTETRKQGRYFLRRFTAGWVLTRSVHHITSLYEKQKLYQEAVELLEKLLSQDAYCHGRRGQWWERLVLNLSKHLKDPLKATEKCLEALKDPHVRTADRLSLRRRLAKLEKDDFEEFPIEEIVIEGELDYRGTSGKKLVFKIDEDTTGSVEALVLQVKPKA
jgi:tetratricopeptide (TPR) repeat protein